jgi:hypothetical protein
VNYKFKEDIEKFIHSSIEDQLISWNKYTQINFDDFSTTQTENIMELIKNIQEETKSKCQNNQYYKMYFDKLIAELKLEDYLKFEGKEATKKSI